MGANDFLKKSQKTTRFRDLIVEKFGLLYGLLMVEEEEKRNTFFIFLSLYVAE